MAHEKLSGDTSSDIVRYLVEAISIVVVAIPEGLPLAVTMVRLWKRKKKRRGRERKKKKKKREKKKKKYVA